MTNTSTMPARIWADLNRPAWSRSLDPVSGFDSAMPYYRADIVERMAEALKKAEHLYTIGILNAPDGLADQVVALRRSALTSYREASNEKA